MMTRREATAGILVASTALADPGTVHGVPRISMR
jgi:hypothetical protein